MTRNKEEDHDTLWSLNQRSQQDLHEKVSNGGVFHLILLVLVFDLDYLTYMHVQGMFATEEFCCLSVPPSGLNINYNGEKEYEETERIPPLHIHNISLFFVPIVCVI